MALSADQMVRSRTGAAQASDFASAVGAPIVQDFSTGGRFHGTNAGGHVFPINPVINVMEFGAKGDGVTDDTAAIQAAVNALGNGQKLIFPPGTYNISSEIQVFGLNRVALIGLGTVTLQWSATSDATKACIKLKWTSYSRIENIQVTAKDGTHVPGFGIYVTSEGAGGSNTTQSNTIIDCGATSCSVTGIQIGKNGTDTDVNVDENKLLNCSATSCAVGFEISGTNTNNTTIRGGFAISCTSYGVQIALNARGVIIDDFLPANNTNYHFKVLRSISGSITLRNLTIELATADNCMFLQVDPISGGIPTFPLLTIENVNCTNNSTVAASKIIDYQGSGSVTMRNCRFGGAVSTSSGAGGKLSFNPANSLTSGVTSLETENIHLYDGAVWDVTTDPSVVHFRWIEKNTGSSGSGVLTDTVSTYSGTILHEDEPLEVRNLTAFTPATGVTVNSYGRVGRIVFKTTLDKTAFVTAGTTADVVFASLPVNTAILGCYIDVPTAFAGLAGTITLQAGTVVASNNLILAFDVKTSTVSMQGKADADLGAQLARATAIQGGRLNTGALTPVVRLTSGIGNIGNGTTTNLTTGSATVYLITENLP